ncbi:hypothetical protein HUB97_04105 [Halorubraceae archaeon YAN]|nr:hypothetical protein [Halorubraceae archaeon YAN]
MNQNQTIIAILLAVVLLLSAGTVGIVYAGLGPLSNDSGDELQGTDQQSLDVTEVSDDGIVITDGDADDEREDDDATVDIDGDSFDVSDLDAPNRVFVDDTVTVSATIENPNDENTTQPVEFRFDGDLVDRRNVTIEANESLTVEIELSTEDVPPARYIHGFLTAEKGELDTIRVIPFADIDFDDQDSDGTAVVVDSVTLSEGGFVAIHDEDDDIIGVSEYLNAGDHEDVSIELFDAVPGADFEQDELEEDTTLTAMAHLDTNDNEEFDFVEDDSEDTPYLDTDNDPIVDQAEITIVDEDEVDEADDAESDDSDDGNGITVTDTETEETETEETETEETETEETETEETETEETETEETETEETETEETETEETETEETETEETETEETETEETETEETETEETETEETETEETETEETETEETETEETETEETETEETETEETETEETETEETEETETEETEETETEETEETETEEDEEDEADDNGSDDDESDDN